MLLSVRGKAEWLVSRRLLIRVVSALIQKLELVDLPDVGFPLDRDIGLEHALSLEVDGPAETDLPPDAVLDVPLLSEVTLTVRDVGVRMVLKGGGQALGLTLTRKEAHVVLEMLARKAKRAGWLNPVMWPDWLAAASESR